MKIATNQERLVELFNSDPRSDTAIAADLNVSKQALCAWRKGTRSPKKSVLVDIARKYNVSLEWLMGFDVPKYDIKLDLKMFDGSVPTTTEARILARGIDQLPEDERKKALAVVQAMFAQYEDYFQNGEQK